MTRRSLVALMAALMLLLTAGFATAADAPNPSTRVSVFIHHSNTNPLGALADANQNMEVPAAIADYNADVAIIVDLSAAAASKPSGTDYGEIVVSLIFEMGLDNAMYATQHRRLDGTVNCALVGLGHPEEVLPFGFWSLDTQYIRPIGRFFYCYLERCFSIKFPKSSCTIRKRFSPSSNYIGVKPTLGTL